MRHVVVMVATSYPRFAGDGVGSFMEPIAKGVAARGHEVHLVAPWHPAIRRGAIDDGVHLHFFHYAPTEALHVFGYAAGLRADTRLRRAAWAMAPVALAAGWFKAMRVASKRRATVMHGHWVVPGGVIADAARGGRPLVVSLHGSDVFVAERSPLAGRLARRVFGHAGWITACSADLADRAVALGADRARTEVVPYGVDTTRFAPQPHARAATREAFDLGTGPLIFTAGRLVSKKGFEFLIDAMGPLAARVPEVRLAIAGDGDLAAELASRAARAGRDRVRLLGNQPQEVIAALSAAADAIAVPSIRDDAGNVDGLPNFALEALASGTPVVATAVGGLPQVVTDGVTGRLVPSRDPGALATALGSVLGDVAAARALGVRARARVEADFGWPRAAERFEAAYERARVR
ncbi:MAG TPA: glycosyltransferase [Vicinamibacterales bacterium]|nr:glycosyltransferase [Vicinamibacterales bacterium]